MTSWSEYVQFYGLGSDLPTWRSTFHNPWSLPCQTTRQHLCLSAVKLQVTFPPITICTSSDVNLPVPFMDTTQPGPTLKHCHHHTAQNKSVCVCGGGHWWLDEVILEVFNDSMKTHIYQRLWQVCSTLSAS